jgi:hypothetical protein
MKAKAEAKAKYRNSLCLPFCLLSTVTGIQGWGNFVNFVGANKTWNKSEHESQPELAIHNS